MMLSLTSSTFQSLISLQAEPAAAPRLPLRAGSWPVRGVQLCDVHLPALAGRGHGGRAPASLTACPACQQRALGGGAGALKQAWCPGSRPRRHSSSRGAAQVPRRGCGGRRQLFADGAQAQDACPTPWWVSLGVCEEASSCCNIDEHSQDLSHAGLACCLVRQTHKPKPAQLLQLGSAAVYSEQGTEPTQAAQVCRSCPSRLQISLLTIASLAAFSAALC